MRVGSLLQGFERELCFAICEEVINGNHGICKLFLHT